jgi:hypothetical protein
MVMRTCVNFVTFFTSSPNQVPCRGRFCLVFLHMAWSVYLSFTSGVTMLLSLHVPYLVCVFQTWDFAHKNHVALYPLYYLVLDISLSISWMGFYPVSVTVGLIVLSCTWTLCLLWHTGCSEYERKIAPQEEETPPSMIPPRPPPLDVQRMMCMAAPLGSECGICLDRSRPIHPVPECGHVFCARCIYRWSLQSMSCPMCRGPLPFLDFSE